MIWVGIDCGLAGAIAFLDDEGREDHVHDTPVIEVEVGGKKRHDYNLQLMAKIIDQSLDDHVGQKHLAMVEESQPWPKDGPVQAFKTGGGLYAWLGILAALRVPYVRVRPAAWKRAMRLPAEKEAVRLRAIEQFPTADLHRKRDHGRSEALFLAAYGRMTRQAMPVGATP